MQKVIYPEKTHGIIWRRDHEDIFRYNGWPTVCRDEKGILYVAGSSFRIRHVCPTGKNCLWISKNEGKSWSNTILINDSIVDDRDTGITSLGGGKLIASWFSNYSDDYCKALLKADLCAEDKATADAALSVWKAKDREKLKKAVGAYISLSDDGGLTWGKPIRVPLTAPHGPVKSKSGKLLFLGKEMPHDYINNGQIIFCISDDGGLTWKKQGTVPFPEGISGDHIHEPHIAELPDGRLLGAIRGENLAGPLPSTVFTTISDDGGKTWSVPKPTGICGLPPHLLVHSSGAVIMSYACRTPGEHCERAAVSHDGGETWSTDYALDDRSGNFWDLGYPSSVELSDGSIMTVYYHAHPGDDYTSFLYTKWKL